MKLTIRAFLVVSVGLFCPSASAQQFSLEQVLQGLSVGVVVAVVSIILLVLLLIIPFVLLRIRKEVIAIRVAQQSMAEDLARASHAMELLAKESERVMQNVS